MPRGKKTGLSLPGLATETKISKKGSQGGEGDLNLFPFEKKEELRVPLERSLLR